MLTMCACRMRRRLTMSVISMREPSSLACTRAAKMLTSLCSMSAAIGRRQADERPRRVVLEHERPRTARRPLRSRGSARRRSRGRRVGDHGHAFSCG